MTEDEIAAYKAGWEDAEAHGDRKDWRQIMFIIERSGVQHYVRYLKNPNKVGWPSEADWTSYSKAHNFEKKCEAEKWIRDNEGKGQFSIKEL